MTPLSVARRAVLLGLAATAIPGLARAQSLPISTPQDFGAQANGLSDDSPAIQAWLEHLISRNVTGYIPPGDYLMMRIVRLRLSDVTRFSMVGAGSHVSRFLVHPSNLEGGFDINGINSRRHQLGLEGFSVIALGQSRIGLRFVTPEGGSQHQRALVMDDVWARGANRKSDHFRTAFDFTGCWRPRIQNSGWDGPFVGVSDADDSPRYLCETGFNLDGCYGASVEDSYAWGCRTGISSRVYEGRIAAIQPVGTNTVRIVLENGPMPFSDRIRVRLRGTGPYDGTHKIARVDARSFDIKADFVGPAQGLVTTELGPEGLNFKDNTINGVQTGILVERPNGREPTCWINGNHINYRDAGVVLDGIKIIQMDQNNTYNEDVDNSYTGVPVDIDLRNASEYIIGGHVFHFDGNAKRVGVRVESDTHGEGDNGLIHHCIFSGRFATAIHLSRNATGVRVGPNLYPGKIARRVRDDSGQNAVE